MEDRDGSATAVVDDGTAGGANDVPIESPFKTTALLTSFGVTSLTFDEFVTPLVSIMVESITTINRKTRD
jgi:hypothetical protein